MSLQHLYVRFNQSPRGVRFIITCLVAMAGGTLFWTLHSPLPWLLGPLISLVVCVILGFDRLWVPAWFRRMGLIIVGVTLGLRITPSIWQTMTEHIGEMVLATVITLAFGLLSAWVLYKVHKVDLTTAVFSNIPGGLSEMVSLGQSQGGNLQIISMFHSIRVMIIVVLTPFLVMLLSHHGVLPPAAPVNQTLGGVQTVILLLFGVAAAALAARLSVPAPFLLGPFFLTMAISLFSTLVGERHALAGILVSSAQLLIGMSIGVEFKREEVIHYRKLCIWALLFSLLLLLMSFSLAAILSYTAGIDLITSILATAPGGLAEMSLTAIATDADPLLVTAFQLFRVLFIVTILPVFVRWFVLRVGNRGRNRGVRE